MKYARVGFWAFSVAKRCSVAALLMAGCTLFVGVSILGLSEIATAQHQPGTVEPANDRSLAVLGQRKAELEVRKLELEVEKLAIDWLPAWVTAILGILAGAAGTGAAVWAGRRATLGALDQSVHEKRLELYPKLVAATAQLALYFPPKTSVAPDDCRAMGQELRAWYFTGGGIVLSVEARDAYFQLARALTRASAAVKLSVPVFPHNAVDISAETVKQYKEELTRGGLDLDRVDDWVFGDSGLETPAGRFKDFVFLQHLSSNLRTKLSEDLRSRRRPAT